MRSSSSLTICGAVLALLLAPALRAQTGPTCNGLTATIVATVPGQITGTQGDDVIVGSAGDDRILGLGGNDTICGGGGNDQITGGQGADVLFGQEGNDTFVWGPGDGNDRMEGSSGSDGLIVSGSNVSENVELSANGNRLRLTRNIASIVLDAAGVERVDFEARGGSDLITVANLAGVGLQQIILDLEGVAGANTSDGQPDAIFVFGSAGDDQMAISSSGNAVNIAGAGPAIQIRNSEGALDTLSVYGGDGHDRITAENLLAGLLKLTIEGGEGDDTITGGRGADTLVAGNGNDTLVWTLGSPADVMSGEAGTDTLRVLGSGAAESVTVSAGTLEAQIYNPLDGVSLLTDVEEMALEVRSGADQVTINTAAGARLQKISLDLRPSTSVSTGDGHPDAIFVNGTTGADHIDIAGTAGRLTLNGLVPAIVIQGSDYARDTLTVNSGFEADVISAQSLAADVIRLVLRGGQGNDLLRGSLGGDVFAWFPGDASDVIDGGAGNDTLQVNGAGASETISMSANGPRFRFTRDIASVVLDVDAVERVTFAAQSGSDTVVLADLSATAVRQVAVDLAGPANPAGDGQPDTISIAALTTNAIATTIGPGTMNVTWVGVRFVVTGVEPLNDRLTLQTPAGAAPVLMSEADRTAADASPLP